jgi:UDP-N-acetylglucosamine 2-epimerase (non-hydrolysing)
MVGACNWCPVTHARGVKTFGKIAQMKRRIMCVFGTRPEAIKLAPVVHALRASNSVEPVVVLTAQHREMLDQMLAWFAIEPQYDLNLMRHGQSLPDLTARVLTAMDDVLAKVKPDLVLVQGDTVTVMAASLAAFYRKIPEEMARRQTSRIATLHFSPTEGAVENLHNEGIKNHVYLTGNTIIDALFDTTRRLDASKIDPSLFAGIDFDHYRVLLVTAHRRENWGDNMSSIARALRQIADAHADVQVLYPIHKNRVVRDSIEPVFAGHKRLLLVEPLDYVPFVYAMQKCFLILTDSGGVQEEAPSLRKPVLVMRSNTERPEAVEAGAARLVGSEEKTIVRAASLLLDSEKEYRSMQIEKSPYGDGKAAARIVNLIEEYLSLKET